MGKSFLRSDTIFADYPAIVPSTFGGGMIPNGWKDRDGLYYIDGSGILQQTGSTSQATTWLTRLSTGTESDLSGAIEVTFTANAGPALWTLCRATDSRNGYSAGCQFNNLYLRFYLGGSATNLTSAGCTLTNGVSYILTQRVIDNGDSTAHLYAKLTTAADPSTIIRELEVDNGQAELQSPGVCGISVDSATPVTRIKTFFEGDEQSVGHVYIKTLSASSVTVAAYAPNGLLLDEPPITYQWHRSTTPDFTPGAGTVLAGATSLEYTDGTIVAGTVYYYKLRAHTDFGDFDSFSLTVAPANAPLKVGIIADSVWDLAPQINTILNDGGLDKIFVRVASRILDREVICVNRALSGSSVDDWQPAGANYMTAVAAFASAGVTHVLIELGLNAGSPGDAATFKTRLGNICTALVSAGYVPVVSYPTFYQPSAGSGREGVYFSQAVSYQPVIDQLISESNGSIKAGARRIFASMSRKPERLKDNLHPNEGGAETVVIHNAMALGTALNSPGFGGGATGSRGRVVNAGA